MRPLTHLAGIALLLLAGHAAVAAGAAAPDARPDRERYRVLWERNMFRKDRRVERPEVRRERPPAPPPERSVVLTGVVCRDGKYLAFLEDFRTNTTVTVGVGESAVRGTLTSITLDYVDYEREGRTTRVNVGGNFEGGGSSSVGSAGAETSGADEAPPAGTDDVLQRLLQRAQRERAQ
jgi:hypothetical protein